MEETEAGEYPTDLVDALSERDLAKAWEAFQAWDDNADHDFAEVVEATTGDSCTSCDSCSNPAWVDETTYVDDEQICGPCLDEYYRQCDACCQYVRNDDSRRWNGEVYCDDCFSERFAYCEECDDYVPVDEHDFEHEDDHCSCEAPHMHFDFPANGHGTIGNDERLVVELPAGTIDDEGLQRITRLVINSLGDDDRPYDRWYVVPAVVESIGAQWQTKRGNFTRRLSSALYSSHKIKLTDGVLSEVGNLARAHSSNGATWNVEVTRDLNQSASDFYHDDSCWWGGYAYSRCALKQWGGIGLRTFDQYDNVSGRAWVQPMRLENGKLVPTHRVIGADAYVVYNGYGDLDGYTGTRIVAHLASMTYKKVPLSIHRQYVNGNTGYLVADEATCQAIDGITITLDEHDQGDANSTDTYATGVFA